MTAPHSAELGQTSDPRALVPGDPASVEADVDLLRTQSPTMEDVGAGLRRVDAPSWTGPASAAFHNDFDPQAARWFGVATIMTDAAAALASYASTLRSSQSLAQDAIDLWAQGEAETARAKFAFDQEQNRTYITAPGAPVPQPDHCAVFVDTGEPLREQARETLTRARTQLQTAGDETARTLARLAGLPDPLATKAQKGDGNASSDWWGAEHKEEGPSTRAKTTGKFGDHQYGSSPWTKDWRGGGNQGDPSAELSLGELSGSAWVWKGEASWTHSYGDLDVSAKTSGFVGADYKATGKIGPDGLGGEVEGFAGAKGEAELGADYGITSSKVHAEGLAGASVKADAAVGPTGVHVGGEAFAGAKGAVDGGFDVGGVGSTFKAEGWAGAGLAGDYDFGFDDHWKFTADGYLGVGLGLGGKVGGGITLDLPKIYHTGEDAVHSLEHLFD